jgi:hypothetical protein
LNEDNDDPNNEMDYDEDELGDITVNGPMAHGGNSNQDSGPCTASADKHEERETRLLKNFGSISLMAKMA